MHFMNLMAVFTAPPEFTVLHGRDEIGRTDPSLLADRIEGPRLLLLGGRSWRVTWTDWKRRRCFVEPADAGGRARWLSDGVGGLSYTVARSMRDVLLGADVPVSLTQRVDDLSIRLRRDLRPSTWRPLVDELQDRMCLPEVDEKALAGLKFSEALPRHLAVGTLAARLADVENTRSVLLGPVGGIDRTRVGLTLRGNGCRAQRAVPQPPHTRPPA
jgi:ATP-dependent Lhr-like helicase